MRVFLTDLWILFEIWKVGTPWNFWSKHGNRGLFWDLHGSAFYPIFFRFADLVNIFSDYWIGSPSSRNHAIFGFNMHPAYCISKNIFRGIHGSERIFLQPQLTLREAKELKKVYIKCKGKIYGILHVLYIHNCPFPDNKTADNTETVLSAIICYGGTGPSTQNYVGLTDV